MLKLHLFVHCILNRVYIVMYVMFSEAPLPQYLNWLTVSVSALREWILHVCVARWDTICVACYNGIVHSHQLCSVENAFIYIFKHFLLSQIHVVFGSYSDIQFLLSSWVVKYLAGFGKFISNCASRKMWTYGSSGSLNDIAATGRGTLNVWYIWWQQEACNLGTVNGLSENQQSLRWIPEMFEFITLVYDATLEWAILLSCGETIVIGHLGIIYGLKY